MELENFFSNKENLNSFVNAKSEEEAKKVLASAGISLSDEEFEQVVGGLNAAIADTKSLSENELSDITGGVNFKGAMGKFGSTLTSSTAKKVYKGVLIGGTVLAGATTAFGIGFGGGWFANKYAEKHRKEYITLSD